MSCFSRGILVEVLEAAYELRNLGYKINDDDFLDEIAQDRGNGGCWGDWTKSPRGEVAVSLLSCESNPETFDEFGFLVKELLLRDALRDSESELPIHWRISW